jgi:hypothetical protein
VEQAVWVVLYKYGRPIPIIKRDILLLEAKTGEIVRKSPFV